MAFKTIGLGLALTCGTFAVSNTINVSSAQAASLGRVNIAGSANFVNGAEKNPAATDTLKFGTDSRVTNSSNGMFAGYVGQNVTISDIALKLISFTPLGNGSIATYSGQAQNPFIKFADGLIFNIDNPFDVTKTSSGKFASGIMPRFTGSFVKGNSLLGEGLLTVNQIKSDGSFSMTAEAVPEPFTILGSVTALGMGVALKKKQIQKLKKEKATA
ncbi:PEP-CTERM sorting domain-containing protein [Calothrix sp. FACHB-156]|nr:PEP-CTERM sorting domain-containing protein [Calothrix sp. FACHB-156]